MRKYAIFWGLGAILIFLPGCATMLPKSEKTADYYWKSHAEIDAVYSLIAEGKTTRLELQAMGLDWRRVPNSRQIDYTEIRNLLLGTNPNVKVENLEDGAQRCLEAKDRCVGQIFSVGVERNDQEGNFIANKTDYRVKTRTTGWSKKLQIFLIREKAGLDSGNDVVTYKRSPVDEPNINQLETKEDKLGPVKMLYNGAIGTIRKLIGF